MTRLADGIDVEGPVQAEVFVVWLHDEIGRASCRERVLTDV